MDKDNKITIKFEKEDAKKFREISEKTNWNDKFLISIALKNYHEKFKVNWEKAVIDALKGEKKK